MHRLGRSIVFFKSPVYLLICAQFFYRLLSVVELNVLLWLWSCVFLLLIVSLCLCVLRFYYEVQPHLKLTSRWTFLFLSMACPFYPNNHTLESALLVLRQLLWPSDAVCLPGIPFSIYLLSPSVFVFKVHFYRYIVESSIFYSGISHLLVLLIKMFIPLIFSVIIDLFGFRSTIFLLAIYLSPLFFIFPFLPSIFLICSSLNISESSLYFFSLEIYNFSFIFGISLSLH